MVRRLVAIALAIGMSGAEALEAQELAKAQAAVKAHMLERIPVDFKDPEAVRFRDVQWYGPIARPVEMSTALAFSGLSVCGEVNGKNSYGAYVGYRRFTAFFSAMYDRRSGKVEKSNLGGLVFERTELQGKLAQKQREFFADQCRVEKSN